MSLAQFWLMFALGLVSSIHCVQMCGPIVLSYSLPLAGAVAPRAKLAWAHFWYNLGRVTTYTALGGLAGAAGGAIGLTARLAGIAHGGRIAAGVAMIAAGIYLTGFVRRAELIRIDSPGIAVDPKIADAYVGRGSIYADQGKLDIAISDYNKAIELEPTFSDAYNNRGIFYASQGELNKSISDLTGY